MLSWYHEAGSDPSLEPPLTDPEILAAVTWSNVGIGGIFDSLASSARL